MAILSAVGHFQKLILLQALLKMWWFREYLFYGPLLNNQGKEYQGTILKIATRLAEENKLKPLVDPREFDMTQVFEAHNQLAEGKALGKIVINIANI